MEPYAGSRRGRRWILALCGASSPKVRQIPDIRPRQILCDKFQSGKKENAVSNSKVGIGARDRWLSLSQAARALGLSKRTLWRARALNLVPVRLDFESMRHYVLWSRLVRAPLLTLGKAAKLCGLRYETLRRWAQKGRLKCWRVRFPWGGRGYRRTSYLEALRAVRRYRRKAIRLRLTIR